MSEDRALTIKQPYASLIMAGVKDVENRAWPVPSTLPLWHTCARCAGRWEPDGGRYDPNASRLHLAAPGTLSCGDAYDEPCKVYPDGPFPFRLWIHAGKEYPHRDDAPEGWAAYEQHVGIVRALGDALSDAEYYEPWTGVLLGSVLVTGCHPWEDCIAGTAPQGAQGCSPWAEDDAYHWTLADPQPLPEPIPMKGRQGLWRVPHNADGFLVGSSSPSTPSTSTD